MDFGSLTPTKKIIKHLSRKSELTGILENNAESGSIHWAIHEYIQTCIYARWHSTRRRCQGLRRMSLYRDLLGYLRICYKAASKHQVTTDESWTADLPFQVDTPRCFRLYLFSLSTKRKMVPLPFKSLIAAARCHFASIRFTVTLTIVKICRLKTILPFIACRFS